MLCTSLHRRRENYPSSPEIIKAASWQTPFMMRSRQLEGKKKGGGERDAIEESDRAFRERTS